VRPKDDLTTGVSTKLMVTISALRDKLLNSSPVKDTTLTRLRLDEASPLSDEGFHVRLLSVRYRVVS